MLEIDLCHKKGLSLQTYVVKNEMKKNGMLLNQLDGRIDQLTELFVFLS